MIFWIVHILFISTFATASTSVKIPEGVYNPLFKEEGEDTFKIKSFKMDKVPVTNKEFYQFVKENNKWSKDKIAPIFADTQYLSHWQNNRPKEKTLNFPVVNVSWFAARAYCESKNMRLPSLNEWEYASNAQHPEVLDKILKWYSKPNQMKDVNSFNENKYGVKAMHGLVWEWVEDFSSVIIVGDSRSTNKTSESLFCGAGSLKAKRPDEYATFMRFAFRSSLNAKSTTKNLGFRCARSLK
ncbi:MAG: formylglycine-generating enzyme family protein [Bdellovibrionales bacterium]|nr:formylglycine-generating enzyme family protein [Bdellovibrionales bacterium]